MRRFIGLLIVACFVCAPVAAVADVVNCSALSHLQEPAECRGGGPGSPVVFTEKARLPGDTAYAQDVGYISDNFISFPLADMTSNTVLGTSTGAPYSFDYDPSATTLWAMDSVAPSLGTINTATGAYTQSVALSGITSPSGLAIDPTDGAFYMSNVDTLYSVNQTTGACTAIGAFGGGSSLMIDIKIDNNGIMYGHDIGSDSIYQIDKATGAATVIGATGYDANFAQGMDFDPSDNTLYAWIYTGSGTGAFCSVDLTTGVATSLSWIDGEWIGAIDVAAGPPIIVYSGHDGTDSCSSNPANSNGVWEPGEYIDLDVAITGGGTFTGVTGTLTALSADVTVPVNTAAWPDLVAGTATLPIAPFGVQLGGAVPCMSRVDFELTINSNEGGPWTYTFGDDIGQALAPNVPVPIPDNDPANPGISTLVIADDVTLTDVNLWLDISHTWVGDVTISLRSPAGTEIVLLDRPGVPVSTVGCSNNNMDITFDDASSFDPEDHCAGTDPWYTGDAMPVGALSAFNGESTAGTWELIVSDSAGGDTGTINDWALLTNPAVSGTCEVCVFDPVQEEAIPTLSGLGLLVLIGILAGAALVMIRRT
jgi:subtilisin-like proprotein convertase family protein